MSYFLQGAGCCGLHAFSRDDSSRHKRLVLAVIASLPYGSHSLIEL